MNEQWYCTSPDHECICDFSLPRAQVANLVFHQISSDAIILYDNVSAFALDTMITVAVEVVFERKPSTS